MLTVPQDLHDPKSKEIADARGVLCPQLLLSYLVKCNLL